MPSEFDKFIQQTQNKGKQQNKLVFVNRRVAGFVVVVFCFFFLRFLSYSDRKVVLSHE